MFVMLSVNTKFDKREKIMKTTTSILRVDRIVFTFEL